MTTSPARHCGLTGAFQAGFQHEEITGELVHFGNWHWVKRSEDWLLLWSQGGCRPLKRRKESPVLSPLHTFHSHLTGLPGFRIQASVFSVGKIVEHFFYIGNFKTIITLCVKNVQRNL